MSNKIQELTAALGGAVEVKGGRVLVHDEPALRSGGIDALVFSGGIGEHAAPIRAVACARLGFLGLAIDPAANAAHAEVLEADGSQVAVRIVACDEESEMAREAFALLQAAPRD